MPPAVDMLWEPKLELSLVWPTTMASPVDVAAMPTAISSSPAPPALTAHCQAPLELIFATNMSAPPAVDNVLEPKAMASWKYPVTNAFPLESTATSNEDAQPLPGIEAADAHCQLPWESNLATNGT